MADYFEVADSFPDIPGGILSVGDTVTGQIGGAGDDIDTVQISVVAGETYTFSISYFEDGAAIPSDFSSFAYASATEEGFELFGQIVYQQGASPGTVSFSFVAVADGDIFVGLDGTSGTTPASGIGYTMTYVSGTEPVTGTGPTEGDDNLVGNMTADRINLLGGNDVFSALGGSDIVHGGTGNDVINGVCGNDQIFGEDGDDMLLGGNGRDLLDGGADNDTLEGGNNDDTLLGGDGDDVLVGGRDMDTLDGGAGNDDLAGGLHDDTLTGGTGADIFRIRTGEGQDTITDFEIGIDRLDLSTFGAWNLSQLSMQQRVDGVRINLGDGNYVDLLGISLADLGEDDFILSPEPEIVATSGGDVLEGGNGNDTFDGGMGSDTIRGNAGSDTLSGGSGQDVIDGGDDNDTISGGSGDDQLFGGEGRDTINGDAGKDKIVGGAGNDTINGGNDNDRIFGDAGNDTLIGENGNDRIEGGTGDDTVFGGAGKDVIDGGSGRDMIYGGFGDDTLTGGADADVFVFDDRMRADTITDFEDGVDMIALVGFGFSDVSDLTLVQVGDDVEIRLSDRDILTIENTTVDQLGNDDFMWMLPLSTG